jgi:hypothetical protein
LTEDPDLDTFLTHGGLSMLAVHQKPNPADDLDDCLGSMTELHE